MTIFNKNVYEDMEADMKILTETHNRLISIIQNI